MCEIQALEHTPEHDRLFRLIAAAPEMYQKLILAMASLRDGGIPAQQLADRIEELLAHIDGEEAEHEHHQR